MARNESGERSNQIMKGIISHTKMSGVYPESSGEPLKVSMLEHIGTPTYPGLGQMDLRRQKTGSVRSSLFRIESTERVTKLFKATLIYCSYNIKHI